MYPNKRFSPVEFLRKADSYANISFLEHLSLGIRPIESEYIP